MVSKTCPPRRNFRKVHRKSLLVTCFVTISETVLSGSLKSSLKCSACSKTPIYEFSENSDVQFLKYLTSKNGKKSRDTIISRTANIRVPRCKGKMFRIKNYYLMLGHVTGSSYSKRIKPILPF